MTVILFDFDGTIADTFQISVEITNQLAAEYGYKIVQTNEIAEIRNMPSKEILKRLGISLFKLPFLARRFRQELNKKFYDVHPHKGIKDALIELKKCGHRFGIITSNSQVNVASFLNKNDINLFDFTYSGSSIFGKDRTISKCLKDNKITRDDAVYVGDEVRDIDASRKARIKVIAAGWGYNTPDVLLQHKPDALVMQPSELTATIELLGCKE